VGRDRRSAFLAGLTALFLLGPLHAQPSFWDRVKEPALKKAYHALRAAERAQVPADERLSGAGLDELYNARARVLIQLAGGEALPDPRLWYLLGEALVRSGEDEEGQSVLRRALAEEPRPELAARAWFDVALASGRLDDHVFEEHAYNRVLDFEWHPERRAIAHLNRGESRMAQRKLVLAQQDFETAIQLSQDAETRALALWSLAVALDRDHNLPRALRRVREAAATNLGSASEPLWAIDSPNVMFSPDYEHHYYRALAFMALGFDTPGLGVPGAASKNERLEALLKSVAHWDLYLSLAEADGPWRNSAERNRRLTEQRRLSELAAPEPPAAGAR
jgi:tetratricopeptide (TPR) repeat protein